MNKDHIEHCSLTCIVIDGEYKVAQFGLHCGDLEGHGYLVLEFLKNFMKKDKFTKNLKACQWADDHEIKHGIHNFESAEILEAIQNHDNGLKLINSLEFAGNSHLCNWVYVIDFDANTFEIHKGQNQHPLETHERFYGFEQTQKLEDTHYYPVKLFMKYDLNRLPCSFDI